MLYNEIVKNPTSISYTVTEGVYWINDEKVLISPVTNISDSMVTSKSM